MNRKIICGVLVTILLTCSIGVGVATNDVETIPVQKEEVMIEEMEETKEEVHEEVINEVVEEVEEEYITFRLTAYCACSKCCGKWATNRPIDKNGKPIIVGASGEVLIENVSCASPLPFGTKIDLGEIGTVVVHDRTADWIVNKYGTYICDIYMTDHQKALEFGVKYIDGLIK